MKALTVLSDHNMIDPDLESELALANEFVLEALKAESGHKQIEFSSISKSTKSNCSAGFESYYGRCSENDLGCFFQASNDDQSLSTMDLLPEQLDEKGLFSNYTTQYLIVLSYEFFSFFFFFVIFFYL